MPSSKSARTRVLDVVAPVVAVAVLLAAWQIGVSTGAISRYQFPTPAQTISALGQELTTPAFWESVGHTLAGWACGFAIGGLAAIIIGSLLAYRKFFVQSASPVIEFFKAIPAVAILPLVILIFGSTFEMKVFLVSFAIFWPLLIQVIYGVRAIDPTAVDAARALGVSGPRRFISITLPAASPYIATGLRIGSATALILAIVAELIGGAAGIGREILLAQNAGPSSYGFMYANIIVTGLLGLVLTGAFTIAERRALHWHESKRITAGASR